MLNWLLRKLGCCKMQGYFGIRECGLCCHYDALFDRCWRGMYALEDLGSGHYACEKFNDKAKYDL